MSRAVSVPGFLLGSFVVFCCVFSTCSTQSHADQKALALSTSSGTAESSSTLPVPGLLINALELYRAGKFDEAIAKYKSVLLQDGKSSDAYAGISVCLLKQEKVAEAFESANKAVSQNADSAAAHSALGDVLFRRGELQEADVEWVKAANSPGSNARAYLGISRLQASMSLFAKARKSTEKAHQLDPADPDIQRRWLGTLPRADQIRELEQYLAHTSNDDKQTRAALEQRLELLRAREQQPGRSCKLAGNVEHTEAVLERLLSDPTHLHGYGLRVNVNNQKMRLLVDTGASGLLISKRLAEKAGVKPLAMTEMHGIGDHGPTKGFVGYADSIKVGALEFQNCLIRVSEKAVLDDDGLIGTDVFSDFLVTLDFPNEKLILSELPKRPDEQQTEKKLDTGDPDDSSAGPEDRAGEAAAKSTSSGQVVAKDSGPKDRYVAPEMRSFTPVFRFGHELLIPTKIGNSAPKLFLIDTGGFSNMISSNAANDVTNVRGDEYMRVKGLSGSVKSVQTADRVMIQFAHFRQENDDLVSFDLSSISRSTGTEVSGILGFAMLRMLNIKIDYRDGLVDFSFTRVP
jgi:tetratricopeptide (TPR) repeat protein